MAFLKEALGEVFKNKILGVNSSSTKKSEKNSAIVLKIAGKNFMALSSMARDLNVSSQNVKQLVSLMGEKPTDTEDKIAGGGLTEDERERKLAVEVEKLKPTPSKKEEKPSLVSKVGAKAFEKFKKSKLGQKTMKGVKKLSDMKKQFTESAFMKSFQKYFAIAALIGIIFVAFKDTFTEWVSGIWDTIKESFDEFVGKIKEWFKDVVQPIIDKVMEFVQPLIDAVSKMFEKIGDFFVSYFGFLKEIFQPVIDFISRVWNKFMGLIDSFKEKIKPTVEGAMKWSGPDGKITKFIQSIGLDKFLGIGQTPQKISEEEDAAEKKKLERQQKEALDTERVREQERKAQYRGEDEIVRKRHGIEEKTMTMRAEERKKAETQAAKKEAPTPAPVTEKPSVKPTPQVEKKEPAAAPAEKVSGMEDVKKMIIKHEGIRFEPYKDSLGLWTIGVGHLIGDGKSLPKEWNRKFSEKEVMDLFEQDFAHHVKIAEQTPSYAKANDGGKGAFIDLAFNMGKWWPKWPSTKKKLEEGDFQGAAAGLQDSKWYQQVKGRAKTIVSLVAQAGGPQGSSISSSSSSLASDQRGQQKPSTPNVINAPTNNTTVVKQSQVASAPKQDTGSKLTAMAA